MKDSIVAYVTALIDRHQRTAENVKKINPYVARYDEIFKDELTDLLDFIEDIPEYKAVSEDTEELEQYADFIKAVRAFSNKKAIISKTTFRHVYKPTYTGVLKDENNNPVEANEILKGKWSIEGEEE